MYDKENRWIIQSLRSKGKRVKSIFFKSSNLCKLLTNYSVGAVSAFLCLSWRLSEVCDPKRMICINLIYLINHVKIWFAWELSLKSNWKYKGMSFSKMWAGICMHALVPE